MEATLHGITDQSKQGNTSSKTGNRDSQAWCDKRAWINSMDFWNESYVGNLSIGEGNVTGKSEIIIVSTRIPDTENLLNDLSPWIVGPAVMIIVFFIALGYLCKKSGIWRRISLTDQGTPRRKNGHQIIRVVDLEQVERTPEVLNAPESHTDRRESIYPYSRYEHPAGTAIISQWSQNVAFDLSLDNPPSYDDNLTEYSECIEENSEENQEIDRSESLPPSYEEAITKSREKIAEN